MEDVYCRVMGGGFRISPLDSQAALRIVTLAESVWPVTVSSAAIQRFLNSLELSALYLHERQLKRLDWTTSVFIRVQIAMHAAIVGPLGILRVEGYWFI
ncbi:hypothetical protein R3P38DRAFT_3237603 [Favolaschia claudopus]|uniref:Uncharacterized protein n=1 Tax=Favolaschia claudopus TaxID=2862362 RepID=A0AAV9ZBP8_9AGAR